MFHVIITDKFSIHMEKPAKICFRGKWEQPKFKGRGKHPYTVHIWAGISKQGVMKILIFDGDMDQKLYLEKILGRTLLPFIPLKFADAHRLQQDNDPKHTSRLPREYMERHGIYWSKIPSESPNLNLIELVWHELKHFLRTIDKQTTKEELVAGITRFWRERMVAENCQDYINQLKKVVPIVI